MSNRSSDRIAAFGDIAKVTLTKGFGAIIDAEDVDIVISYNWQTGGNERCRYAQRGIRFQGSRSTQMMHRLIMPTSAGLMIDHIDGNGLNNKKSNLRIVNNAQNQMNQSMRSNNRSGFKGVSFASGSKKWKAQIEHNGSVEYLGLFQSAQLASAAYEAAAAELHGEFRRSK
jgi:hypothetical protein